MRTSKIITLIIVGLLVFGSAGLFGYILFLKPYRTSSCSFCNFHFLSKKKAAVDPKTIVKDPSLVAFDAAVALQNAGKLAEAQAAWLAWLANYPDSSKKNDAMMFLGKINMELFSLPADQKESYTVVKGDSLDRIARKQKSNPELIQRVNHLPNINLQIGEVLFVPELKTSLEIDRDGKVLILRNHDQFLKSYALLSFPPEGAQKKPAQTTTIVDRIATAGNKRTAFGDKKYPDSERVILLRSFSSIVAAPAPNVPTTSASSTTPDATPAATGSAVAMPAGFVISKEDMKEIFPFVTKETPVSIR